MRQILLAALLVVSGAALAQAQTPVINPTYVQFDHVDWATAASYELSYFALPVKADHSCDWTGTPAAGATSTTVIPKPATTNGIAMSATLTAKPVGCFVAKMRALDTGGLYSIWADAADPFSWTPAAVSNLTLKK
jgi:hypothetical protein